MSLSIYLKRISLNQWRYYYNKLLLIEVPLTASCIKGLMPLASDSPTVTLQPITASDALPLETTNAVAECLRSEPSFHEALSPDDYCSDNEWLSGQWRFDERLLLSNRDQSWPEQPIAVNIYSQIVLYGCAHCDRKDGVALIAPQTIEPMGFIVSTNSAKDGVRERPVSALLGLFTGQVAPATAHTLKISEELCCVSDLLFGLSCLPRL
ncbi:MAG: hypothetical protein AAFV90_20110 [Cyanobacteria bacterium J06634_5]